MRAIKIPPLEIQKFILDNFYATDKGFIYRHYLDDDRQIGYVTEFNNHPYISVKILNKRYMGHHVVWFLRTNKWPTSEIDHKDGNGLNNSIDNLELSNRVKQMSNRSDQSKYGVGVVEHWNRRGKVGYMARYRNKYIGRFPTPEEASLAYWKVRNADESHLQL